MSTPLLLGQLSAEEFAELPEPADGTQQELVRGKVVVMPPPSGYQGAVCSRIVRRLSTWIEDRELGILTSNDSGVILERDPDTVRAPDLAFFSKERLPNFPRTGYPAVPPDLAIEVLSPSDVFLRMLGKVEMYLRAGVRLVWVIVPEDNGVSVHVPDAPVRVLTADDVLDGGAVLPGFSCPVRQLFP
jgi:Uma2 family endonuclease